MHFAGRRQSCGLVPPFTARKEAPSQAAAKREAFHASSNLVLVSVVTGDQVLISAGRSMAPYGRLTLEGALRLYGRASPLRGLQPAGHAESNKGRQKRLRKLASAEVALLRASFTGRAAVRVDGGLVSAAVNGHFASENGVPRESLSAKAISSPAKEVALVAAPDKPGAIVLASAIRRCGRVREMAVTANAPVEKRILWIN